MFNHTQGIKMYKIQKNLKSFGLNVKSHVKDIQEKLFGNRYVGASLEKLEIGQEKIEILERFMTKKSEFMVISGPVGVGKSFITASLVPWMVKEFNAVAVCSEFDLLERITREVNDILDVDLIVIDYVGRDELVEWQKNKIFEVIDELYNSMKPVIFLTSLNECDFYVYGVSAKDKLFASRNCILDLSLSPNLRRKGL